MNKYNLNTSQVQRFNTFYKGRRVASFMIRPLYKPTRNQESIYSGEFDNLDDLISVLLGWKAKGITEIFSEDYEQGGYYYIETEPEEVFSLRLKEYEEELTKLIECYDTAYEICKLTNEGEFEEADQLLTELKANKYYYNDWSKS